MQDNSSFNYTNRPIQRANDSDYMDISVNRPWGQEPVGHPNPALALMLYAQCFKNDEVSYKYNKWIDFCDDRIQDARELPPKTLEMVDGMFKNVNKACRKSVGGRF